MARKSCCHSDLKVSKLTDSTSARVPTSLCIAAHPGVDEGHNVALAVHLLDECRLQRREFAFLVVPMDGILAQAAASKIATWAAHPSSPKPNRPAPRVVNCQPALTQRLNRGRIL